MRTYRSRANLMSSISRSQTRTSLTATTLSGRYITIASHQLAASGMLEVLKKMLPEAWCVRMEHNQRFRAVTTEIRPILMECEDWRRMLENPACARNSVQLPLT